MTPAVEPLRPADLDAVLALSTSEGWNQTAADWRRMIELEPAGCFCARDGRRVVGTVTTATYGRELAWIGMMVVHPEFRRQGIGAALMRRALDHLRGQSIASVKLDATPAGRPLYESLGFTAEAELERWQGVARPGAAAGPRPRNADPPQRLFTLDRKAFGVDRSRLLERLLAEPAGEPIVVCSEQDLPQGYVLARPGRAATYIGPLVAATAGVGEQLLDGVLAQFAGGEVCLDLHPGGPLGPGVLTDRGLSKRRGLLRMHHGAPSVAGMGPSIGASAGPEFG